jgi:putative Ca2+/H+ antiporter (TMEM165/GDT1 family)
MGDREMSGLKQARIVWTVVFLGITLTAIVMECVAGLLHPAGTIPWTEYLARYVPWPFQLVAYVALAVWLPFHFWRHDHMRKVAYKQGWRDALEHWSIHDPRDDAH